MFGLFKSAEKGVTVIDKVWMSKTAKLNACREMFKIDPRCIFIVWFETTRDELTHELSLSSQNNTVMMADNIMAEQIQNHIVVFAEHHPLRQKEQQAFQRLLLKEVNVLSSMDEPFFMHFGGERTLAVMRQLGMKVDEVIGHTMINRAIKNAQEKIEKKVVAEKLAPSQEEWYRLNVK